MFSLPLHVEPAGGAGGGGKTLPLPCISTVSVAKTVPFLADSQEPRSINAGKTLPLPCVSAAFVSEAVPFLSDFQRSRSSGPTSHRLPANACCWAVRRCLWHHVQLERSVRGGRGLLHHPQPTPTTFTPSPEYTVRPGLPRTVLANRGPQLLPCVSTVFVAKTLPLLADVQGHPRRQRRPAGSWAACRLGRCSARGRCTKGAAFLRPFTAFPCLWLTRVDCLGGGERASRGPALRCALVCKHKIFTKGRSNFSRLTEIRPAFP